MSDVVLRLTSLISSNPITVGVTALQVSGGTNNPLTAVGGAFYPSRHRLVCRIINNSPSATLSLGSLSTVTVLAGWFKQLSPGQMVELDINGSVPVWIISSAASTPVTVEELS